MVASALSPAASPKRTFGRFELRKLLGKSAAAMSWLAFDPRSGAEVVLSMPRLQPLDAAALVLWQDGVRAAGRLDHPNLAQVAESGVQDHWPFIAVERGTQLTLVEWLAAHPNPKPAEVVAWICQLLRGLAFAHESGAVHFDLQLHNLLINDRGAVQLIGLGVAPVSHLDEADSARARPPVPMPQPVRPVLVDPGDLRQRRAAAARDVLATGLLLHCLLTGQPVLEQPDTALVMARMAPAGRELVRLPWSTLLPIPEPLRAIANRCTSSQERLRYQNARTLLGALAGWLDAQSGDAGGPLGTLLNRLNTVGHLPALPGLAGRVAKITSLEGQRTDQIADNVLGDVALTFELLRTLNSAQVQGTQVQGNGPVLTLRRIVALIGVNGVRLASNTLRQWPGPLNETQAAALEALLERVRLAGHVAQSLRPRGYDAQVVYLITVLQSLGRLMVRYHFADEAEQIDQLMKPAPMAATGPDGSTMHQPGLREQPAAFAVLGIDAETLGAAVARHWGLGDEIMHMARRLPTDAPIRKPDSDADVLRLTASAANDVVDAATLTQGPQTAVVLGQIAQRYARALSIGLRDITDALQAGRDTMRQGGAAQARTEALPIAHEPPASPTFTAFPTSPASPASPAPTAPTVSTA